MLKLRTLIILLILFWSTIALAEPPFSLPGPQELRKIRGAIINTTAGELYVRLYPNEAPWHVANFKFLADQNYYQNAPFHIFQKGYLAQTGSANKDPASGPRYSLPAEFNEKKHLAGALSMVRKPDYLDINHDRNSHSSQFRIMLSDAPHMDGQFTVFGRVIKGKKVLNKLTQADRILNITVYRNDKK